MSSDLGAKGPCAVCSAPGRACARCRVDFYCGKEHQTQDWARHRLGCSFLEVRHDALLGRHFVAAKEIPAGQVLMREEPLVSFPTSWNIPHDGSLFTMCVGCGAEAAEPARVSQCSGCGWPVCGARCARRTEHTAECKAFQRAKFRLESGDASRPGSTLFDALTALRVALAFEDPKIGARLRSLPHRLPDLETALSDAGAYRDAVKEAHKSFGARLRRAALWMIDVARVRCVPQEELERALGLAMINGMEAASGTEFHLVGGVFAGLAMAGHSCLPTAWRYPYDRQGKGMQLVATRTLSKGERLSTAFIRDLLNPQLACDVDRRRAALFHLTGTVCRCRLCEDPTQVGLYLSSWHCACWQHHDCHELVAVLEGSRWRCDGCHCEGATSAQDGERFMSALMDATLSGRVGGGKAWVKEGSHLDGAMGMGMPQLLEDYFRGLVEAGNTTVAQWEEFIADALAPNGPLHPTHHLVLRAKRQILCPDKTGVEGDILHCKLRMPTTIEQARRVAPHGRDLLRFVNVVRPGVNQYRADLLRQLVALGLVSLGLFVGQPHQYATRKAQWKAVVKELTEDLTALKTASVSPFELETVYQVISQKDMLLAKLSPALRADVHGLSAV